MGPARAQAAAGALTAAPGDALLVRGLLRRAGRSVRAPGEVIVAEEVVRRRRRRPRPTERPLRAGVEALTGALTGRGLKRAQRAAWCASRGSALGERRAQLLAGGAIAVDMESVWLAAGAAERPFGVVRVVLDSPTHELMRPQAAAGALRAARALRTVAGALHDWAPGALR